MNCASRLIECPHCGAAGCRNDKCGNLVLAAGKCTKCGNSVKKAIPLRKVCRREIELQQHRQAQRVAAAIAVVQPVQLAPPRPLEGPRTWRPEPPPARVVVPVHAPPAAVTQPDSGTRRSAWLSGAGLVALLLTFGGYASHSAFTSQPSAGASAGAGSTLYVDAAVLAARYEANAARAEDLFRGRPITLSGRLERVAEKHVSLRQGPATIRCELGRAATAEERALLPETPVVVRGTVAGRGDESRIEISACEFLPASD
jgi:hypothetical protein